MCFLLCAAFSPSSRFGRTGDWLNASPHLETGIAAGDKFVLEGGRLIQDGDKVQFEER